MTSFIFGIIDLNANKIIKIVHTYSKLSGMFNISLFANCIEEFVASKFTELLFTKSKFVIYPIIIEDSVKVTEYIITVLFPISLNILISSGRFVAAPAIRNVIAIPGDAPLATRAAINGICPTAHTYITHASIAILPRDSKPGFPKYFELYYLEK